MTCDLRLVSIISIGLLSLGFLSDSGIWHSGSRGIYEPAVRCVLADPVDGAVLYAGTSKALYKSADRGKSYRAVLRPAGEQKSVNDIYIPPGQSAVVYAATDAGLYESRDDGGTWSRIYYSSDTESRQCLSVVRRNHVIYLGTRKGLFRKNDREANWHKITEGLDNKPVYRIAADESFLYLATGQALFRLDTQTQAHTVRKVFSLGIGEGRGQEGDSEWAPAERDDRFIRSVHVSGPPQAHLFAASSKGVYFSADRGEKWQRLPSDNLALEDLTSLLVLENNTANQGDCPAAPLGCLGLLAGTEKGVFFLSKGRWIPVYKGMETNGINDFARDAQGTVYAATDKGVFYLPAGKALPSFDSLPSRQASGPSERDIGEMEKRFEREPDINEVHRLAVEYAEVSHEKIKKWRRQAQRRAWFPELDIGVDGGRDWSSSDSIWGSYSGGGQHYVGPDDKTRREDFGWDVSLSWDFADLVWSTDQTTIDSRSKLMVELREDILNEVTRLYFERRRIQVELAPGGSLDPQSKTDKEMRIAELTALIDALTGGEFSSRIEKNSLTAAGAAEKEERR